MKAEDDITQEDQASTETMAQSIVRSVIGLSIFAIVTAGLIAITQVNTKDIILEQIKIARSKALLEIVPLSEHNNDMLADSFWLEATQSLGLGEKSVEAVRVKDTNSGEEYNIPATGFFVAIGHKPNSGIFKGQLDMDDAGYLITTPGTSKTNLPGVFAAGDIQDKIYRQAITAAGSGCMAALDAERYLAEFGH